MPVAYVVAAVVRPGEPPQVCNIHTEQVCGAVHFASELGWKSQMVLPTHLGLDFGFGGTTMAMTESAASGCRLQLQIESLKFIVP